MVSALCVCTRSPGWSQHEAFTGWAGRWDLGEQHKPVRGEENKEADMTNQVRGCDSIPACLLQVVDPKDCWQLRSSRQASSEDRAARGPTGVINHVIHHCALLCPGDSLPSSLLIHSPSSVLLLWNQYQPSIPKGSSKEISIVLQFQIGQVKGGGGVATCWRCSVPTN